jgi:K+-transporting ATPase c subunit
MVWSGSRGQFLEDLAVPGSQAEAQKWQRGYFHGRMPDGSAAFKEHQTKLELKPFKVAKG